MAGPAAPVVGLVADVLYSVVQETQARVVQETQSRVVGRPYNSLEVAGLV